MEYPMIGDAFACNQVMAAVSASHGNYSMLIHPDGTTKEFDSEYGTISAYLESLEVAKGGVAVSTPFTAVKRGSISLEMVGNELTITGDQLISFTLYELDGSLICETKLSGESRTVHLTQASGIYIARIKDKNGLNSQRISVGIK